MQLLSNGEKIGEKAAQPPTRAHFIDLPGLTSVRLCAGDRPNCRLRRYGRNSTDEMGDDNKSNGSNFRPHRCCPGADGPEDPAAPDLEVGPQRRG